jgi:glycosyltransferase involved in cell wall biosynthesis
VGLNARLRDIYGLQKPDDALVQEFGSSLSDGVGEINIFHINGDEVEQTMAHLTFNGPLTGYNIVYPAWELSQYPEAWAALLDSFDEIWAPSAFIEESLNKVCKKPVIHMPLATEVLLPQFIGREYFSISGDSFVFLFFFDLRSYATRKNPDGVISAIRKLAERRPNSDVTVVLKVLGGDTNPDELLLLEKSLAKVNFKKLFITEELSDCEVKNLVRSCDCFISLHRSEGYGRGIAEAMTSGKAVIATEYSGNMDYMSHETAKCVPFNLVPVLENQYPHWENQVWAEPDIEAAVNFMVEFLDAPDLAGKFGQRAQAHMRANFSYPAIGRLLLDRLMKIKTKNIGVGN